MKIVNNCWFPDAERATAWVEKLPLVDGFPAYQNDRFCAAMEAVRDLRRTGPSDLRTAVDGGAHVGLWTVPLLRAGFRTVHAFEPITELADCILRNVETHVTGLKTLTVHRGALHHVREELFITGSDAKSVGWSVGVPLEENAKMVTRAVPGMMLDALRLQDVDFIKLDVEGHELHALRGAAWTIGRCMPVIMIEEKHDHAMAASDWLNQAGYRCIWRKKHDFLWVPK